MSKHTPGPWKWDDQELIAADGSIVCDDGSAYGEYCVRLHPESANARLIAAAPELLEALHEARRAIGDHYAPNDCYATGPLTGDSFRDLVQCPACSAIAMYDAAIAKARGDA